MLQDAMIGEERNVGETIGYFCRLSFGAAALGVAVGFVALWVRTCVVKAFCDSLMP